MLNVALRAALAAAAAILLSSCGSEPRFWEGPDEFDVQRHNWCTVMRDQGVPCDY
jgi:hypothetical protein